MSVNGPISPKQCYYEMDYSFYSFYWLDSLEIQLDHNFTYYRSLSKNCDVKPRISHCDSQNLQYKTHPEFWPSHRRIFKTSLYYKTRLILETRRYFLQTRVVNMTATKISDYMYCVRNQFSCSQVSTGRSHKAPCTPLGSISTPLWKQIERSAESSCKHHHLWFHYVM